MKKYILPFMSIAMLMAMASCSSSDDEVAEIKEESKLVPMTFTATQESNAGTRTALSTGNSVIWKTDDKISVFDGVASTEYNHEFSLSSDEGSTSGSFTGDVNSQDATSFTAVYPYTSGATLESDWKVSGIELPAEQTATEDSFDPNAALMMAVSTAENKNQLDFKNAVSLVKVTTDFPCKKIVLTAEVDIAGTGTLTMTYNSANDTYTSLFEFSSGNSKTITLKPKTGSNSFAAGTYYIAVPPITLTNGFSISFHASDEYCVYTKSSIRSNTFKRNMIKDFGTFKKTEDENWKWSHTSRGKVDASQEVDMGVFNIGGTNYRLIFTKYNLTADGLAASVSAYGDFFAWGATKPWYKKITGTTVADSDWEKEGGYIQENHPFYDSETNKYTKYTSDESILVPEEDAANVILGGDWQIPTLKIWNALTKLSSKGYDNYTTCCYFTNNGNTLYLSRAGTFSGLSWSNSSGYAYYWSSTSHGGGVAFNLMYVSGNLMVVYYNFHCGLPIRPVRLVEVDN